MLTKEAEVDERLKHMNEVFLASLEGFKSGSSRRRESGRGDESGGEGSNSQSSSLSGYRGVGGGGGGALGRGVPSGLGRRETQGGGVLP
ncbi:hypothetical protein HYDPIDRAFT_120530 [Hydnomerulius pinastri MD-312]|uniref:Uncharacterized protein n=1 Tax=Hydnomerulius pinastri MD-312 TaxID=994086 RepID=A0A0C2L7K5_9AGAM|nr:hypothetical protein HYDPIDRAFT_120530 [Hydnomerulius pinastri MD-312]